MSQGEKKHPCPDCRVCQWCSDTRCATCRGLAERPRKLSMAEQIALYEKLNREARECGECDCCREQKELPNE